MQRTKKELRNCMRSFAPEMLPLYVWQKMSALFYWKNMRLIGLAIVSYSVNIRYKE